MKQFNRPNPSALVAVVGVVLFGGFGVAESQAQESARPAPLVARPVLLEPPVEVSTRPIPPSAVAAVPIEIPVEKTAPPASPKAPSTFRTERQLADFVASGEGMAMRNVTDLRKLRIPVPWRAKWPEMRVDLRYQNSGALISQRSQMELWWAGGMVSQKALDGESVNGRLLAEIPNRQLRPGAHALEIRTLHQTGESGGDPFGEHLWTQIDASESSLTLSHQLRPLSPVLSDFPRLLDRYGWEPFRLRLVTAESWALTGIHLEWISRVVERSALLLESVPLEISHASVLDSTGDHFVIGLREEILPVLPESIASQITDSFAGIFPHPLDDRFFVAVVAGSNREGIEKAVRAFAATEFALPPEPFLDLTGVALPELPSGPPWPVLRPGEERSFANLGGRTWELQGLSSERIALPVHLPPGISADTSAKLKLELQMAWSPVRRDATVDVFVNGNPEVTIPIGKADAPRFDGYELDLPLSSFRPGENSIAFQPNLIPPNAGDGRPVNWDSLRFVLDDASVLMLPALDREIKLPDLQLTARSAVPAVNMGTAEHPQAFTIFMSDRESGGLSAGATLLAKFVQTAGRRIPKSRLSFEMPSAESNYVVVSSEETLPRELVPVGAGIKFKDSERALVAQFESPLKEGRIGMVVAAALDADLSECVRELIQPDHWSRLAGDAVTWETGSEGEVTSRFGQFEGFTVYHGGDIKRRSGNGFSAAWILYSLGILLLVGGGVTFFLRRERRRNRLPGQVSIDAPLWSLGSEDRI